MPPVENKSALDAKLVNAFMSATLDVLQTMAGTEANMKEIVPHQGYKPSGDISALIGIVGDEGEGMLALSFPLTLANLIVARLLGVTPETLSSGDRCDGIGELVNMISGNAKIKLSEQSSYRLTLPSIIQGQNHEIMDSTRNQPYLIMVFEVEGQLFHLKVTFKFA